MHRLANSTPYSVRKLIREGQITEPTAGMCRGYAQGNLVILPQSVADDFLRFCQLNSKACPILEVTSSGQRELKRLALGSDIATDIPSYRVYEKGKLMGEYDNISSLWRNDFVSFILGCSFTFEAALIDAGIEIRHISKGCNVPMYITNIDCEPAGIFSGPMVVSMRPIPVEQIEKTIAITAQYPSVHGAPIHIGDISSIGITNIDKPDFGDPVEIKPNELPVFWACGVTPQAVAMKVKPEIMITHSPGHMFITDIKNTELASFEVLAEEGE